MGAVDEKDCAPDRYWLRHSGFVGEPLFSRLGGMSQDHWEFVIAYGLLRRFMPSPEYVLEIGVYGGWTMLAWAEMGVKRAVGVDIDPHVSAPLDSRVRIVEADSHLASTRERVEELLPEGVDFLFIDGDHSLRGCEADYNIYAPMVRRGGIIGFHDILNGDVRATWREVVRKYPTVQVQNTNPDGSRFGIGLVFRLPHVGPFRTISVED